MAQHAQHLAHPATPQPELGSPTAEPFRAGVAPDGPGPGVYRLTIRPDGGSATFHGTLRVDERGGGRTVASGDLYCYPRLAVVRRRAPMRAVDPTPEWRPPTMSALGRSARPLGAPAHPVARYHTFLAVTAARAGDSGRGVTITAEQHRYLPPRGAFRGAFAPSPKVVTLELERRPRATGYTSAYFEGALVEDGVPRGRVVLGRVSAFPGPEAHRPALS